MTMEIQVEVFWVVTPCSVVVGYQRFSGPCCHHLHQPRGPRLEYKLHGSKDDASLIDIILHSLSGL